MYLVVKSFMHFHLLVLEQREAWQSHMMGRGILIGCLREVSPTSSEVFYHSMAVGETQRSGRKLDSLPELM